MSELKLQQCRVDGRYDVLDCLGRGSYSEVYVARDVAAADGSPQMVVLKALNPYLQGAPDPELEQTLVENFRNEAVALDRVRHPNVINRLGHGTAIDLHDRVFHYLVLEYLPGGDLQALTRRRRLQLDGALFYLRQVASGLEHAHSHGVIHRDIKPQNLLLTADQHTVKIADFGVAKLEAGEGGITRVGTDVYAAPEHHPLMQTGQLDTSPLSRVGAQLTPAADVYSFAKTAYTLLTGESPRRFSQRPITELPASAASEFWAWDVTRVLERATQNNPSKRHQTVREFWEELQEAAMPPTRRLGEGEPAPDLTEVGGANGDGLKSVPPAPPAPAFPKAAERAADPRARQSSNFRIVVPVGASPPPPAPAPTQTRREPPPVLRSAAPEASAVRHTGPPAPARPRLSDRSKKWLVALLLVAAFAGMLAATHFYFRREPRPTVPPRAPEQAQQQEPMAVGEEYVAHRTDVNLRSAPGGQKVGTVTKDSVVRVLGVNGGWVQVQVLQYGKPKERPEHQDQGWADRDYFRRRQ